MSKLHYELKCGKCGASPIRIKTVNKMGRGKSGTYYICTTKCGRIENKDVKEVQ